MKPGAKCPSLAEIQADPERLGPRAIRHCVYKAEIWQNRRRGAQLGVEQAERQENYWRARHRNLLALAANGWKP